VNADVQGGPDSGADLRALLDWVSRQPEGADLELACPEHPDPARGPRGREVVVAPDCLEGVGSHLLLELLVAGAASLTLALAGCAARDVVRDRSSTLIALLDQLGHTGRLRCTETGERGLRRPVHAATSMPVGRRQLLFLPQAPRRELPDTSATPHQRLVTAVRALAGGAHEAAQAAVHEPGAPALRLASRGCTACGVCVQACPEEALAIEVITTGTSSAGPASGDTHPRGDETHLWLRPAACSGCRACLDVCPAGALSADGQEAWGVLLTDAEVVLETLDTAACRRCGGRFPADGGALCPVCAYRSTDPFGTTLPPEVLSRLSPEVARRFSDPTVR